MKLDVSLYRTVSYIIFADLINMPFESKPNQTIWGEPFQFCQFKLEFPIVEALVGTSAAASAMRGRATSAGAVGVRHSGWTQGEEQGLEVVGTCRGLTNI